MSQETIALITQFFPIALMILVFYLIIFLPQRKREKKTKQMLNSLQVGSTITTIGGIAGKIVNIKDDELTIESGIEKTKMLVKRWAVKEVEKQVEG